MSFLQRHILPILPNIHFTSKRLNIAPKQTGYYNKSSVVFVYIITVITHTPSAFSLNTLALFFTDLQAVKYVPCTNIPQIIPMKYIPY